MARTTRPQWNSLSTLLPSKLSDWGPQSLAILNCENHSLSLLHLWPVFCTMIVNHNKAHFGFRCRRTELSSESFNHITDLGWYSIIYLNPSKGGLKGPKQVFMYYQTDPLYIGTLLSAKTHYSTYRCCMFTIICILNEIRSPKHCVLLVWQITRSELSVW